MRKLTNDKIQQIHKLASRGLPDAEIAKMLGVGVGTVNKYRALPPDENPQEDIPEEVPAGVSLGDVDDYIARLERNLKRADAAGDFATVNAISARLVAFLEYKRKATPPAPPDPNADPDFIEAAREAREMLHRLVATATE